MKHKALLATLFIAGGFLTNLQAQVQVNKPLQMTGTSNEDRRITGVGEAADSLDAVNVASVLHNRLTFAAAGATGNAYTVNLRVAPERYAAGMIVTFKAGAANGGAMTLNVNGLGAKPVYKNVNEPLEANDIVAGQVVSVIYDGTAFQIISQLKAGSGFKGNLAGDVTGTQSATVISTGAVTTGKIADAAVTDAKLASGISYNKLVGAPTALPPTGTAGGDLTGTYPNPAIASGAVTNDKIASVAYSKVTGAPTALPPTGAAGGDLQGDFPNPALKDGSVSTAKVRDGAITADKLAAGVIPSALPPSGTAGGDLTGSYPNPVIADGAVNSIKIQDGAIISLKLADGSVLTAKIADAAITAAKVADGAITTPKLADGAVTNEKVASVDYSKITGAPAALPPTGSAGGDLAGSYPAPQIAADAVTTAKLASGAVTNDKVANGISYSKLIDTPASLPPSGDAGGDLSGTFPNPAIAAGAVTASKVADGSIANNHISATAAIAYSKLALANSIATADLAAAAVTTPKLADGAVTNEKIASVDYAKVTGAPTALPPTGSAGGDLAGTYPNPSIATGAVTNDKIASVAYSKVTGAPTTLPPSGLAGGDLEGDYPNPALRDAAVSTAKVMDGAITTAKIAPGAVSGDKINTTGATSGQVLSYDGTGAVWADAQSALTGDAGGDLTGTYPDPVIANAAVTASKVAAGAISNSHVADMAGIQYSKLNLANSIVSTDITNNAITTFKIANQAVTLNKLSPAGASNGQVLTFNGTSIVWGAPSSPVSGTAGGDLTGTYPNPTIAAGTVTSGKIADGAITNADVSNTAAIAYSKLALANSIATADLVNSAVNTDKVSDGAITSAKIADGAITDAKIASGISYSKLIGAPTALAPTGDAGGDLTGTYPNPVIATDAITEVKIADGAVVANKIGSGAVTTDKIGNGAVTPVKISATGAIAGQMLSFDGTSVGWSTPAAGGGAALQYHGTINAAASFASGEKVVYNNTLLNSGNQMSEGLFTAAAAGLYQFHASLPAAAGDPRFLALRVNGFDVFTGSAATSMSVGSPYNGTIAALSLGVSYPLEAGDQVEIIVYNNSGSATPLTNGASRLLITKLN